MGSILRAPRLNPTQVPTVPVEIDWGHPLALGLVFCAPLGGNTGELVGLSGTAPIPADGAIAGAPQGPCLLLNTDVLQYSPTNLPSVFTSSSSPNATLAFWGVAPPVTAGNYVQQALSVGTTTYANCSVAMNYGNNGPASVFWPSAGATNRGGSVGTFGVASGEVFHAGATFDSAALAAAAFLNGQPCGTATLTGYQSSPSDVILNIGYPPSPAKLWGATVHARVLSQSEIAFLFAEPFSMLRPIVRRAWFVPASTSLAVSSAFIFINESISVAVAISDEQTESLSQAKSNKQGNFESLGSMQAGTMAGHDALSRDAAVSSAPAENTGSTNSLDSPYLDSSGANTSVNTLGDAPVSWLASASSAVPSTATESLGSDSTSEKSPSGGEASLGSVEPATAESGSSTLVQREALGGSLGEAASRDEPLVDSNLSTQTSEKTVALEGLGSAASTVSPYIDTTGTNDTVETLGNAPLNWLASVVDSTLSRLETATAYSSTHQQPAESQGTAVSLGSVRTTSVSALTLNYAAMSSILSGITGESTLSQECLSTLRSMLSAIVGVISTLTPALDSPPLESLRSFSAPAGIADSEILGVLLQNLHALAEFAGANNLVIGADSIALEALSNAITDAVAFVDTLRGPAAPAPSRVLEVAITKRMLSVAISLRKLVTEE